MWKITSCWHQLHWKQNKNVPAAVFCIRNHWFLREITWYLFRWYILILPKDNLQLVNSHLTKIQGDSFKVFCGGHTNEPDTIMLMIWKFVYVSYIILIASPSVYGLCEAHCTYDVWKDWSCKCNNSTQKRIRDMCCPKGPTTREECASFCNLTLYWQEEAPCIKCNNGGVFDHHLGRCKCPPTFTGAFCCGKISWLSLYHWRKTVHPCFMNIVKKKQQMCQMCYVTQELNDALILYVHII